MAIGMRTRMWTTAGAVLSGLILAGCTGEEQEPVSVGLITKQEENPYWVSMRDVARETADDLDELGERLLVVGAVHRQHRVVAEPRPRPLDEAVGRRVEAVGDGEQVGRVAIATRQILRAHP